MGCDHGESTAAVRDTIDVEYARQLAIHGNEVRAVHACAAELALSLDDCVHVLGLTGLDGVQSGTWRLEDPPSTPHRPGWDSGTMTTTYRKQRSGAPAGFFAAEAAGLRWLAEPRVVPVVEVLDEGPDHVDLERLESVPASSTAARRFGAELARLHDSGAPGFGWTPSDTAWFGPLDAPFPVATTPRGDFTTYWATDRLAPLAEAAARHLDAEGRRAVDAALTAIGTGAFAGIAGEGTETPSRLHGDLWSGNVLWTPEGTTLIDPAAHGGHRLEDLALLEMFGTPHLADIQAGYEEQHPLPRSWREDVPAHQLFALLAHVRIFGSAYAAPTAEAARAVSRRAHELGAR